MKAALKNKCLVSSIGSLYDNEMQWSGGSSFYRPEIKMPMLDILENKNKYAIEFIVPGITEDDYTFSIRKDLLKVIISGSKRKKGAAPAGSTKSKRFSRTFHLPSNADTKHIEGICESGVLTLEIPKK